MKSSAIQDINIITPEDRKDKVYTEPMKGYYLATYGFENDQNDQTPKDWVFVDDDETDKNPCDINVINNYYGHNKVMRINDPNGFFHVHGINYFDARTSGTVEFWINTRTDDQAGIAMSLKSDGSIGPFIGFASEFIDGIYYGRYYYYNGPTLVEPLPFFTFRANTWHHHRIVFNCLTHKYNWYIDNSRAVYNANFHSSSGNTLNSLHISTGGNSDTDHPIGCLDAVGYSWDEDYEIGDNKEEGFLLSYNCETELDKISYSLDSEDKITILGDKTIRVMEGFHTIQVFGEDSDGTTHTSKIRNFSYRYWNLTGSPIVIDDSVSEKSWATTAANNDWCSGSGTNNDPYVIKNVYIDGLSSGNCIWIKKSAHPFEIRNCNVFNSGTDYSYEYTGPDSGIHLGIFGGTKVNNGTLLNNQISQNLVGIFIYGLNNKISGNNIEINDIGIEIAESSSSNEIWENNFKENNQSAIDNSVAGVNRWDNGVIGNFWDDYQDYIGHDFDNDGIGDYPHNISGNAKSKDFFPIYYNPDFLITQDDIKFEKDVEFTDIKAIITNQGPDYTRDILVSFYDNDTSGNAVQIGTDQKIEGLKKDQSKIVSVENWTPRKYHIVVVIIDENNTISETDEKNNIAMKGAGGHTPVLLKVESKFGVWDGNSVGTFFKDVCINNIFYITIYDLDGAEDVVKVFFEVNGLKKNGTLVDGTNNKWEFTYNMGKLPRGDSHLYITAYDKGGLDYAPLHSETRDVTINVIAFPDWILDYVDEKPSPDKLPDWMNIGIEGVLYIFFTIDIGEFSKSFPSSLPGIGGDKSCPDIAITFTFEYDLLTKEAKLSIEGAFTFETEIGGRHTEFELAIEGTGVFNEEFELTELGINIDFNAKITVWGGKIEAKKYVTVGVGIDVEFSFALDFIFKVIGDTLQWGETTLNLYVGLVGWIEFKLDAGVIEATLRGEAGGGVDFTFLWSETEGFSWGFQGHLRIAYEIKLKFLCFEWGTGGSLKWTFKDLSPAELNQTIEEQPWNYTKNLSIRMDSRPRVATDHEDNAMMVWTKNRNESGVIYTDIWYSPWEGTDWGEANYITFDEYADFDPAITYDSNGNAFVVWSRVTEDINSLTSENPIDLFGSQEIAYSMWDGSTWTAPQLITNDSYANGRAIISSGQNGEIMTVWVGDPDHNFTTTKDLELFYSIWNGTHWSAKEQLTDNEYMDYSASIANNSLGDIMVCWIRDLDGNRTTTFDTKLLYTIWNGNEWSEPIEVIESNENKESPSLAFDQNGDALITWVGSSHNITRLYFASMDKDTKEWTTPEIVHEDMFFVFHPAINVDPNNTAVIVWRGFEDDEAERDYYFTHNTTDTYFDGEICYAVKDLTRPDSAWSEVKYLTSDNKTDWMASAVIIRGYSNDLLLVWDKQGLVLNLVHEIKPDLLIKDSDITFSNQYPNEGDQITITAAIQNIGDVKTENVNVSFYNGNPDNGDLIGSALINSIDYDEKINVPIQWNVKSGITDIYVVIDHLDLISEINEDNNVAFNKIYCLADLFVNPEDISFSNLNPSEGDAILIKTTIHNQGGSSADNIAVNFYSNGNLIGTNFTSLAKDDSKLVSILWKATGGYNNISVVIDMNNKIMEWDEMNNNASTIISILPDLEIFSFNLFDEVMSYGKIIDLKAEIRNIGASGANNVLLEFYDGNPYSDGDLIYSTIVNITKDEVYPFLFENWKPSAGTHQIFVLIDRKNVIDELNETNNVIYGECAFLVHPDLIILEPEVIYAIDSINLNIPVKNIGDGGATGILVEIYDGDPLIGGKIIRPCLIPHIKGGEIQNINIKIYKIPKNQLHIIVDPLNLISESDETNNKYILSIHTVDAGIDQDVNEGDTVQFSGTLDQGTIEDFDFNWDFGDENVGQGPTATHAYGDNGVYIATLTVIGPNYIGKDQVKINVANVAPTSNAGSDQIVDEDTLVLFNGIYWDPGSLDTHTFTWDFGDGFTASNNLTPTHTYANPGIYEVALTITDDDGGIGINTCTVTVLDKTAPNTMIHLSGTLGLEGWYVSEVLITLSADDESSEVAITGYSFDGITWMEYTDPFTISDEGITRVYYNSTDNVGNVELTKTKLIKIDKTKPQTSLSYIQVSGVGSIVTLIPSDPVSGVVSIVYSLDGNTWESYVSPFTLSMGGIVPVYYYATDVAGNVESIKTEFVMVDIYPPITTIELDGTLGLNNWYISDVLVTLFAADDLMGVGMTTYSLDGTNWIKYTNPFIISEEGHITIYYNSTDTVGNMESPNTINLWIDKTAPTTTLTIQEPNYGSGPTYVSTSTKFFLYAEDNPSGSGVNKIEYRISQGDWITYTIPFSIPDKGSYTIDYRSTDVAGNMETEKSIWIVVNASELTYNGEISGFYSDPVILKARLIDVATQQGIVGKTIEFNLGNQIASAVTLSDGVACVTIIIDQPSGIYTVAASFAECEDYLASAITSDFTIEKENVYAIYTGSTVVPTTVEKITLRATISDEIDGYWGDLTKINITFIIYSMSMDPLNPLAIYGPYQVETTDVDGIGVVIIEIPNLAENNYLVQIIFRPDENKYYEGPDSDLVIINIYKPSGDFVSGGGWIEDPSGSKGSFGFIVKYKKNGLPTGQMIYIYRAGDWIYIIKSNAWEGIAVVDTHAFFEAKCVVLQFNFKTGEYIFSEGNYRFRIDVWDENKDGGVDIFQIRVYDKNGLIYHEAGFEPFGFLEGGNIFIYTDKKK